MKKLIKIFYSKDDIVNIQNIFIIDCISIL